MRLTTTSSIVCLCLLFLCVVDTAAFLSLSFSAKKPIPVLIRRRQLAVAASTNKDDNNNNNDHTTNLEDDWLDRPFFDPNDFSDDDSTLLGKFAHLVKTDYNLAETLYAGCFVAFMMIVSQEMLRFQIHGQTLHTLF